METKISGESLFNDGVGVVLFITFYEVAKIGYENISIWEIVWLFVREAGGGLLLGWLLGYLCFYMLRSIDNYVVEVMITLATCDGRIFSCRIVACKRPLGNGNSGIDYR